VRQAAPAHVAPAAGAFRRDAPRRPRRAPQGIAAGIGQGLAPRTFLLQPIGDPLIEALQPLVLGPFLNIERALRLCRACQVGLPFGHECPPGIGGSRLLAFDHHAGMPRLGGLQGRLR
jgi:hypothetical protein